MAYVFNHATKRIEVSQLDSNVLMQNLINSLREEEASERGIVYDTIAVASGKDSLGGGVFTGITVLLLSTWQAEFEAGNYMASIGGGNLVASVGNPVAYVVGGPQVQVTQSAASTVVATGGSALTAEEHNKLMALDTTDVPTIMTTVQEIKSIETGNWEIVGNQMIFKNASNVEIMRFNLFDGNNQPTMVNAMKRVKV